MLMEVASQSAYASPIARYLTCSTLNMSKLYSESSSWPCWSSLFPEPGLSISDYWKLCTPTLTLQHVQMKWMASREEHRTLKIARKGWDIIFSLYEAWMQCYIRRWSNILVSMKSFLSMHVLSAMTNCKHRIRTCPLTKLMLQNDTNWKCIHNSTLNDRLKW